MDPMEFRYSLYSSAQEHEHYTCIPDVLWWTRNHRYLPEQDVDDGNQVFDHHRRHRHRHRHHSRYDDNDNDKDGGSGAGSGAGAGAW